MDTSVTIEPAYGALDEIRALFAAYTAMLVACDPSFQRYLDIQHYDDEVRDPAAKYGPPDGRLYLARLADGTAAGCIALRRLDGARCEMKRLYVRPEYRGRGIARRLIRKLTDDARQLGYRHLRPSASTGGWAFTRSPATTTAPWIPRCSSSWTCRLSVQI